MQNKKITYFIGITVIFFGLSYIFMTPKEIHEGDFTAYCESIKPDSYPREIEVEGKTIDIIEFREYGIRYRLPRYKKNSFEFSQFKNKAIKACEGWL